MTNDQITMFIKCIDDMTDDLLEIADVLEEYQINVKMENGRYLNPVSAIRSKVDVIWENTQAIMGNYEIVRCRDCRFAVAKGYGCGRGNDGYLDVEPDGFCAWGERSRE